MASSFGRLLAMVVLLLQLQPALLPALCGFVKRAPATACEQTAVPEQVGAAVDSPFHTLPCANPALCGVPATAVPNAVVVPLVVTDLESAGVFVVSRIRSGDAPAPLSPPPQA